MLRCAAALLFRCQDTGLRNYASFMLHFAFHVLITTP